MAPKKYSTDKKNNDKKSKPEDEFAKLAASLPKDAQIKLKEVRKSLDKFKDTLVNKFGQYIMGIAVVPPKLDEKQLASLPPELQQAAKTQQGMTPMPAQMPPQLSPSMGPAGGMPGVTTPMKPVPGLAPAVQPNQPTKDSISVIVLVDDSDSKKMTKEELKNKLTTIIQQTATNIDKKIIPQTIIISDLWQSCYDAKYDLVRAIAYAAPIYDNGMMAAIKISEIHKDMVLKKFEKYIVSYVLAGSLVQGKATPESDIDVFIVVDDTDVKRMTRAELKDKLRAIIIGMGVDAGEMTGIKNKINIQVYILTDFLG